MDIGLTGFMNMDEIDFELKKDEISKLFKFIPGFPKDGVNFLDIMPIFKSPVSVRNAVDIIVHEIEKKEWKFDFVVGIEARGFLLGVPLAERLDAGFVAIRKGGKLPGKVIQVSSSKEYGKDVLEIQEDNDLKDKSVLIFDDVLATGGTTMAAIELLKKSGARIVGAAYLADIAYLKKVEGFDCEICFPLKVMS